MTKGLSKRQHRRSAWLARQVEGPAEGQGGQRQGIEKGARSERDREEGREGVRDALASELHRIDDRIDESREEEPVVREYDRNEGGKREREVEKVEGGQGSKRGQDEVVLGVNVSALRRGGASDRDIVDLLAMKAKSTPPVDQRSSHTQVATPSNAHGALDSFTYNTKGPDTLGQGLRDSQGGDGSIEPKEDFPSHNKRGRFGMGEYRGGGYGQGRDYMYNRKYSESQGQYGYSEGQEVGPRRYGFPGFRGHRGRGRRYEYGRGGALESEYPNLEVCALREPPAQPVVSEEEVPLEEEPSTSSPKEPSRHNRVAKPSCRYVTQVKPPCMPVPADNQVLVNPSVTVKASKGDTPTTGTIGNTEAVPEAEAMPRQAADTQNRRIRPDVLKQIKGMLPTKHSFTMEACTDKDGWNCVLGPGVARCSLNKSFLSADLKGHHIWLNPPFTGCTPFIEHYKEQKKLHPEISCRGHMGS